LNINWRLGTLVLRIKPVDVCQNKVQKLDHTNAWWVINHKIRCSS